MQQLQVFRPYLTERWRQLALVTGLGLARPLAGSVGFMLIVPILQRLQLPANSTNERLNQLLAYLPASDHLEWVLALFFVLILITALVTYLQAIVSEKLEQDILFELRRDLFTSMMNSQWQHLKQIHQADYIRFLTEEVESVSTTLDRLITLTGQLALICVYTGLCFYLSPTLTLVAVTLGLLLLATVLPVQRMIAKIGERHLDASEGLFRLAADQINGLKAIKSSGTQSRHIQAFGQTNAALAGEEVRYASLSSLTQLLHSLISACAFCLLIYAALTFLEIDLATLAVVALVFTRLVPQVSRLHVYLQQFAFLGPSLLAVAKLIERIAQHPEVIGSKSAFDVASGVQVRNLTYQYPDAISPVLVNIQANFQYPSLTVINGLSGIGKSTLADLLAGITLPTSGEINIGGISLDPENQHDWRRCVSYLPQETFIIEASIRDNLNLLLAHPVSDQLLLDALEQSAADFVTQLPEGLATIIGDGGINLSVGERQRLQIARALLDPRPLLIMDETTSNLDPYSEQAIARTLQRLKKNHIVIVITHRTGFNLIADQMITINPIHGKPETQTADVSDNNSSDATGSQSH